jgi:hypothetical protein
VVLSEGELAGGKADLPALLHRVNPAHGAAPCGRGGAQVVRQVGAGRVRPVTLALHNQELASTLPVLTYEDVRI